jgi:thioredoxin-related protein
MSAFPQGFAEEASGKIKGGIEHSMPDWFKDSFLDMQADIAEAEKANKHVMLFFHLNNCPYCEKMLHDNFTTGNTKDYIQQHFDVIAINVKGDREIQFSKEQSYTEKALSKQLKIQYTPTILFLDIKNNAVVRLNGYRSSGQFTNILHYVNDKAYKDMSLADYLEKNSKQDIYTLKNNYLFKETTNLSLVKTPLAIIFEDSSCDECEHLHNKLLTRDDVKTELKPFTLVRLDANSTESIIAPNGDKTTAKELAKNLNMLYRPGIVLFDEGKEVTRLDGMLFSFHFKELFRYVSGGYYKKYATYNEYLSERQAELLKQGIDIHIVD